MTYTSHGHHVPGSPTDEADYSEAVTKARCGGPGLCTECSQEAARIQQMLSAGGQKPSVEEWLKKKTSGVLLNELAQSDRFDNPYNRPQGTIIKGRVPDEIVNDEPFKTVPLAIYVGGTRRIVGTATVIGKEVTCWIDEDDESANLSQMITAGIIDDVTLSFKIPPPVGPRGLDGLLKDEGSLFNINRFKITE